MTDKEIYCHIDRRLYRIKWRVQGFENYAFAENRKLYNLTTGNEVGKVLKGGYTFGYNLKGKFYSLKKLKPLITKV